MCYRHYFFWQSARSARNLPGTMGRQGTGTMEQNFHRHLPTRHTIKRLVRNLFRWVPVLVLFTVLISILSYRLVGM